MDFKICTIGSLAEMESLPVAKIVDYPLEKRDYRPFAQAIICRNTTHLLLRLWAFEVTPPQGSELRAVLYLFSDRPDTALQVRLTADGDTPRYRVAMATGTGEEPLANVGFRSWCGEDLQGIYWGGQVAIPLEEIGKLPQPGQLFDGNLYKLCEAPGHAHQGSFFPAQWANPFAPASMGPMQIVEY